MNESEKTNEDLQSLSHELERNVHDRTQELDIAEHQLEQAHVLTALGTAAAKIVHDLANPINAISDSVQLQEISLAEGSERLYALITEMTQGLKQETARVAALIAELREFSRPLRLNCEPMNFARLVARVIGKNFPLSA